MKNIKDIRILPLYQGISKDTCLTQLKVLLSCHSTCFMNELMKNKENLRSGKIILYYIENRLKGIIILCLKVTRNAKMLNILIWLIIIIVS